MTHPSPFDPFEGDDAGGEILEPGADLLESLPPRGSRASQELPVQLAGYRIEGVLGRGAMGVVYAASAPDADFPIALKVLKFDAPDDDEGDMHVERFRREVEAVAALKHPGIPRFHDAGQLEDGRLYLAMERLDGEDLEEIWEQTSRTDLLRYITAALGPLGLAHERGIVHRDLKPANLFVADGGERVVLLDFGVARQAGDARMRTATGIALGTPAYMSPEQVNAPSTAGPMSDIWSAGVMIYEALTGQLPFDGESVHALLVAVCTRPPTPLRERDPNVHPALDAVVMRCMAPRAADRFATATELQAALEAVLEQPDVIAYLEGRSTLSTLPPPSETPTDITGLLADSGPVLAPQRRPAWLPWAVLGVFMLVGAGAVWALMGGADTGAEVAEPQELPAAVGAEAEGEGTLGGIEDPDGTESGTDDLEADGETDTLPGADDGDREPDVDPDGEAGEAPAERAEEAVGDTEAVAAAMRPRPTMATRRVAPPSMDEAPPTSTEAVQAQSSMTESATPTETMTEAPAETTAETMEAPPRRLVKRVVRRRVVRMTQSMMGGTPTRMQRPGFVTF